MLLAFKGKLKEVSGGFALVVLIAILALGIKTYMNFLKLVIDSQ